MQALLSAILVFDQIRIDQCVNVSIVPQDWRQLSRLLVIQLCV